MRKYIYCGNGFFNTKSHLTIPLSGLLSLTHTGSCKHIYSNHTTYNRFTPNKSHRVNCPSLNPPYSTIGTLLNSRYHPNHCLVSGINPWAIKYMLSAQHKKVLSIGQSHQNTACYPQFHLHCFSGIQLSSLIFFLFVLLCS